MIGFAEFEFDLPKALLSELIGLLDGMSAARLEAAAAAALPEVQGVYQLYLGEKLVYIGKTDAEMGLRSRLMRHARKLEQRKNLDEDVSFKAVRIMVFTAMDLETQLIRHYRRSPADVSWNGSGFGSNDPGRERETTNKNTDGFDASYPINIDSEISVLPAGRISVAAALAELKRALPYTLRYETERDARGRARRNHPHPDLLSDDAWIVVPQSPYTLRTLMRLIVSALGPKWQATEFPSHVILYKESRTYEFGATI